MFFGNVGSTEATQQNLLTEVGASYTLSFDLMSDGQSTNQFVVTWDGQELFNSFNIVQGTQTLTFDDLIGGAEATTALVFAGRSDPSFLALDNVSVVAGTIPEPGAYGTVAAAASLVGAAFIRRKRRA